MNTKLSLVISVVGLVLTHFAQASASSPQPPNFLVILTDDQGWAGTSLLMDPNNPDSRSDYYHTPNIDKLLTEGMRFTQGYASAAWCTPSRRSIQSGMSPSRHTYSRTPDQGESQFAKMLSIPRMLKSANPEYRCAHFGKWHLHYDSVTPETLGYDASDGDTTNEEGNESTATDSNNRSETSSADVNDNPKKIFSLNKSVCNFIETQVQTNHPWFIQLSEYAVHLRIGYRQATLDGLKDRPLGKKHIVPEYAAMTEDLDAGIGELMARLRSMNVLNNTYIIFLSDNGARGKLPGPGGAKIESDEGFNYPLAESKHSIYEGGLRVPFAIIGPGIKAGAVSNIPVSGVDILPTLADLAGYKGSLGDRLDGGSLRELSFGTANAVKRGNDFLVFESAGGEKPRNTPNPQPSDYKVSMRDGDYKLVKFYGGKGDGVKELYDLTKDVGEKNNLVSKMPERAKEMEKLVDDYMEKVGGAVKKDPEATKKGKNVKKGKGREEAAED